MSRQAQLTDASKGEREQAVGRHTAAEQERRDAQRGIDDAARNRAAADRGGQARQEHARASDNSVQEEERVLLAKREHAGKLDLEHLASRTARQEQEQHLEGGNGLIGHFPNTQPLAEELHARSTAFAEKRKAMGKACFQFEQERPLVEQEVRLREQRDALESTRAPTSCVRAGVPREAGLRTAHRGFYES
eukprot:gene33549-29084_t